jgi:hypothetical protein
MRTKHWILQTRPKNYIPAFLVITKFAATRFAPSNPMAALKLPLAEKDKKRYTRMK